MNTALTLFFILNVITTFIIVFRQLLQKNKYQDPVYLNNLKLITEFICLVQSLNDYVTWVQLDQIKANFSAVGKYFQNNCAGIAR